MCVCARYAAFPVFLLRLDQHRLGAQDFNPEQFILFQLTIDAIPKPHHSSTQTSPLVIFVSLTLTKCHNPGEHGYADKHLQALRSDAGDLSVIVGSVTCSGLEFDLSSLWGDMEP